MDLSALNGERHWEAYQEEWVCGSGRAREAQLQDKGGIDDHRNQVDDHFQRRDRPLLELFQKPLDVSASRE